VFGEAVGVPRGADRTWMCREMERMVTAVTTTADRTSGYFGALIP
jgi:hypothetical protein